MSVTFKHSRLSSVHVLLQLGELLLIFNNFDFVFNSQEIYWYIQNHYPFCTNCFNRIMSLIWLREVLFFMFLYMWKRTCREDKKLSSKANVTVITNTWHFMSEPKLNRKEISWVWNQFEMITISECKIRANQLSKSCLLIFAYKCYIMS